MKRGSRRAKTTRSSRPNTLSSEHDTTLQPIVEEVSSEVDNKSHEDPIIAPACAPTRRSVRTLKAKSVWSTSSLAKKRRIGNITTTPVEENSSPRKKQSTLQEDTNKEENVKVTSDDIADVTLVGNVESSVIEDSSSTLLDHDSESQKIVEDVTAKQPCNINSSKELPKPNDEDHQCIHEDPVGEEETSIHHWEENSPHLSCNESNNDCIDESTIETSLSTLPQKQTESLSKTMMEKEQSTNNVITENSSSDINLQSNNEDELKGSLPLHLDHETAPNPEDSNVSSSILNEADDDHNTNLEIASKRKSLEEISDVTKNLITEPLIHEAVDSTLNTEQDNLVNATSMSNSIQHNNSNSSSPDDVLLDDIPSNSISIPDANLNLQQQDSDEAADSSHVDQTFLQNTHDVAYPPRKKHRIEVESIKYLSDEEHSILQTEPSLSVMSIPDKSLRNDEIVIESQQNDPHANDSKDLLGTNTNVENAKEVILLETSSIRDERVQVDNSSKKPFQDPRNDENPTVSINNVDSLSDNPFNVDDVVMEDKASEQNSFDFVSRNLTSTVAAFDNVSVSETIDNDASNQDIPQDGISIQLTNTISSTIQEVKETNQDIGSTSSPVLESHISDFDVVEKIDSETSKQSTSQPSDASGRMKRIGPSLNAIKVQMYTVGIRAHRGNGAERLFSGYWNALFRYFNVISSSDSHGRRRRLQGTREIIDKFLITKKLKRLHNALILGKF
jgi:hypothetical protein